MIEVTNLTKKYGKFVAVNDSTFTAQNGKLTVLLGPNGAGKSTTIKCIAGLLDYEGNIGIDGYDNKTVEAKKAFGYIPETPSLYEMLTVEEHINFIGKAYKVDDYWNYAEELLEYFHLSDKRKTVAKNLSKGMTQKLSMILGLMVKPTSILIDEPMVGLDPNAIEDVLKLMIKLKNDGVAVLVSTHIIDIIDEIWDEAYIMDKGHIVKHVEKETLDNQTLKEIYFECVKESVA